MAIHLKHGKHSPNVLKVNLEYDPYFLIQKQRRRPYQNSTQKFIDCSKRDSND